MCRVAAGLTFSGAQPPGGTAEWSLLKHESHKDIDEKHPFSVLLLLRATRTQVLVFLPSGPFQELFFVRHPLISQLNPFFHCLVPPPRPLEEELLTASPPCWVWCFWQAPRSSRWSRDSRDPQPEGVVLCLLSRLRALTAWLSSTKNLLRIEDWTGCTHKHL